MLYGLGTPTTREFNQFRIPQTSGPAYAVPTSAFMAPKPPRFLSSVLTGSSTLRPEATEEEPSRYICDRRLIIFKRILKTLPAINIVSALTAGASVGALTFEEFHPSTTGLYRASEALFASCAIAAVTSILLSAMLLFMFETVEPVTMRDYLLLWTPIIFLDWSILAFVFGMTLWYAEKNVIGRAVVIEIQTGLMVVLSIYISFRMLVMLRQKGGLGNVEEGLPRGLRGEK